MPDTRQASPDTPVCPVCRGPLRFLSVVGGGSLRRWEVARFVCPVDGFVYRTRQGMPGRAEGGASDFRLVPLRPSPSPLRASVALAEPD